MKNITPEQFSQIIEAALLVAGRPLTSGQLQKLFDELDPPELEDIKAVIAALQEKYRHSGIDITEIASGFQFQAKTHLSPWLSKLWEERAPRYSRALLETLALIAYRQPITRAEVEDIRGVSANSHHFKTLLEREWIRIIGHRDIPGKPALYGTTKEFLDYFNLKNLSELPTLSELKELKEFTHLPKALVEKLELELESESESESESENVTTDE